MAIRIVRLGSMRGEAEGTRLGTVRRPPRGVARSDYARLDYYDAWLPELAPSAQLVKLAQGAADDAGWARFAKMYRREMGAPERAHLLDALAKLSRQADFSVGCYCERPERCHRSILRELLLEHGAVVVPGE
jgi:uncharacterized protein YeaO (DUF488 family)